MEPDPTRPPAALSSQRLQWVRPLAVLDPRRITTSIAIALLLVACDAPGARGPAHPSLALEVRDFATIPASRPSGPAARISMLKAAYDGTGRLFVNDQRGKLHLIKGGRVTTFLDLAEHFTDFITGPGLGTGFAAFHFHPAFRSNGRFYTAHSERGGASTPDLRGPVDLPAAQDGVIVEWTMKDPAADVFSGVKREVLRIALPNHIHGVQEIAFNPNAAPGEPDFGMLYVCVGDGGSVALHNPQNTGRPDSPLGAILRIDPAGRDRRNGGYGVPPDNPWADEGDRRLAEVWAYGLRNPHRISWDTGGSRTMWIADIGENRVEEVNLGQAGANYGWPLREGPFVFDPEQLTVTGPAPRDDAARGLVPPAAHFPHPRGYAVVGGFVYRGAALPSLQGKYVFGDIPTGRLFHLDVADLEGGHEPVIHDLKLLVEGRPTPLASLVGERRADLRFGIDAVGELYLLTKTDGKIRVLTEDLSLAHRSAP